MKSVSYSIMLLMICISLQGCKNECNQDKECDDDVYCNGTEKCLEGKCITLLDFPCNDQIACTIDHCNEADHSCYHELPDNDQDGYFAEGCLQGDDCNDSDPDIHPGAPEICNAKDDDCNGVVEEDLDGDGHLDPLSCPNGDDCDDQNKNVYPGAPEICDDLDNNCINGIEDEQDTDQDGFIDETCGGDDCNDEDGSIYPNRPEVCNGRDDNCDGRCDETFQCCRGGSRACITACESTGSQKCDQSCMFEDCQPPKESCNGRDDDCDKSIDEDFPCIAKEKVACETVCGSIGIGICTNQCRIPAPSDCSPLSELCNGRDDDCDDLVDETFVCQAGKPTACITECLTIGTGTCTNECNPPPPEDCTPPEENCINQIDDDCDGLIDETCSGNEYY